MHHCRWLFGYVPTLRLDLQHWMLRDGFYVGKELVFAPVDLGKGVNGGKTQVLDSACGTGASDDFGRSAQLKCLYRRLGR